MNNDSQKFTPDLAKKLEENFGIFTSETEKEIGKKLKEIPFGSLPIILETNKNLILSRFYEGCDSQHKIYKIIEGKDVNVKEYQEKLNSFIDNKSKYINDYVPLNGVKK